MNRALGGNDALIERITLKNKEFVLVIENTKKWVTTQSS
jgi:hypothetical protein